MDFIFCEEREQRVSRAVCEHNIRKGHCTQDLLKCRKVKNTKAVDPEGELRTLWDKQGVPKEKQDEIIKGVEEKAQPGAKIGPFTIGARTPQLNLFEL